MAAIGTVRYHGKPTGVRCDAATGLPEQVSVYLDFLTADDKQVNVEISMGDAAILCSQLADLLKLKLVP